MATEILAVNNSVLRSVSPYGASAYRMNATRYIDM